MTEYVVLVDENDNEIGLEEKQAAHEKGLLHRAFSVLLFRKDNPRFMLMQQRAAHKYHCPLLWANACCSHQRQGEATLDAAGRRMGEELGLPPSIELFPAGSFVYRAQVGELIEHECDHVLVGFIENKDIPFNPEEVATTEWVDVNALILNDFKTPFRKYVPWLNQVVYKALAEGLSPVHEEILGKYKAAA